MGYDHGIADRLRARGLNVVEVAGWRTRGSADFNPRGSVDHHTAGSSRGNAPSLGICINGRSDLPGPLCNVFIARDNTCYVVAAGRANHAGTGGWKGLSGNSSVYGIERENVGTPAEPWRTDQTWVACSAHAALLQGKDPNLLCEHKEWTVRKSDAHTVTGADMRKLTTAFMGQAPPAPAPPPPAGSPEYWAALRRFIAGTLLPNVQGLPDMGGGDPRFLHVLILQKAINLVSGRGIAENGVYGDETVKAVSDFQRYMGVPWSLTDRQKGDFPGAAGTFTRFTLSLLVQKIRDGQA